MSEIFVGPEKIRYVVHKDVVCSQSPFFSAALNGRFIESSSQQLELPDCDAKAFDHVILWLYQSRLEPLEYFFKDKKPTYFTLLDLYATADQLDIEGLRNAVVNRVAELAEKTNSVPTPTDTYILYDAIRENSPLRELILDLFAFKKTDNLIATHPDEWHPSFLRDLVCKLKRPGPKALSRHDLRTWEPVTWTAVKACEVCRAVVKPGTSGCVCEGCGKGFCRGCVEKGSAGTSMDWSVVEKECKPWLRGMCGYHEHVETERCM
jgi:BTB/POZ domain